ncbi:hypothetical protein KPC_1995 [Acinetobacter stercoris]|uniref:Uncharacterized protein n=1 Tax=Acinetobacter stercoris TaxID=2126983 RepID=A0A2U3MZG8_9GAMM|nr:hypothetical protein KPC_1995 [Acinetobacter stercoris]
MKESIVHVRQDQGKEADLYCYRDSNHEIVRIMDMEGNTLAHNPRSRCVIWMSEIWYY